MTEANVNFFINISLMVWFIIFALLVWEQINQKAIVITSELQNKEKNIVPPEKTIVVIEV